MTDHFAIQVNALTREFNGFTAVDNLSFQVRTGEIMGFLGANGAGKTTAIRMLTGLLEPTSGKAVVAGFDVGSNPDQVKRHIGYMSQKFSLFDDLTVAENIRFFGGIYGLKRPVIRERTQSLLDNLGMASQKDTLVRSLPLGWKQKIAFVTALVHRPAIIFLDEPTSGVDPVTRRQFWEMIYGEAESGTTVFVTTHYMDEAEYCDHVSIMAEGRIRAIDSPAALKREFKAESMDDVFVTLARSGVP